MSEARSDHRRSGRKKSSNRLLWLLLVPVLFLLVASISDQQSYRQQAQTLSCGNPGNPGNEMGVGKACTKGGKECSKTGSPYCTADFVDEGPGFCSKACLTTNDCGTGAACISDALGKVCMPTACIITPTVTNAPSSNPLTPTIATSTTPKPITKPPTPTITPTKNSAGKTAIFQLDVLLDGIGKAGDGGNSSGSGNFNPFFRDHTLYIEIYGLNNNLIATAETIASFNAQKGSFIGNTSLRNLDSGAYIITVRADRYLKTQLPGVQLVTAGKSHQLPQVRLIAGDINGDDKINILDYNILIGCYSDLLPAANCTRENKILSDLTDDTFVNQFDFNLFIRELVSVNATK